MTEKRGVPTQLNLQAMTPEGLLDMIAEQRQIQKEAKYMEGLCRQALDSKRDLSKSTVESGNNLGTYSTVTQERLDGDTIKGQFSHDQLVEKGWLKVSEYVKLDIKKKG